jgi:hypothetical protein
MIDYIAEIQTAFLNVHGCDATYVETIPVVEEFQGKTIWEGDVEVFNIRGHPKATRGYGWGYTTEVHGRSRRYMFAVLELPPVDSPQAAVKAVIISEIKNARKKETSR